MGSSVEDADLLRALLDPLLENLECDLVALGENHGSALGFHGGDEVLDLVELAAEYQLEAVGTVAAEEDFNHVSDVHRRGCLARLHHFELCLVALEHHRQQAFVAIILHRLEGGRVHVRVDEILRGVVDPAQLVVEVERLLHHHLERADRIAALAGVEVSGLQRPLAIAADHLVE